MRISAVPRIDQLDLTGPYEILPRAPGFEALLVAKTLDPVASQWGMRILPDVCFAEAPSFDVLVVPGGFGVNAAMADETTLDFVRTAAAQAQYTVSVCTGALLIGAAGLLVDRRATTHWAYLDLLEKFGATPVQARTVRDGTIFTGGGVTAGIDVALRLIGDMCGVDTAKRVQRAVEYDPEPPFGALDPIEAADRHAVARDLYGDAMDATAHAVALASVAKV